MSIRRILLPAFGLLACTPSHGLGPQLGPARTPAEAPPASVAARQKTPPSKPPQTAASGTAKPIQKAPVSTPIPSQPAQTPLRGLLHPVFKIAGAGHALKFIGQQFQAPVLALGFMGSKKMLARDSTQGPFLFDERWTQGLNVFAIDHFIGDMQKSPVLLGIETTGRIGWSVVFQRHARRWRLKKKLSRGSFFAGIGRWSKNRVLGYIKPFPFIKNGAYAFRLIGPGSSKDLPVPALKPKTADHFGAAEPVVEPRQLAVFESGHVVVLSKTTFEHFEPGKTRGRIGPLPAKATSELLATHGPSEVVVPTKGGLAHYNGKAWKRIAVPSSDKVVGLAFHQGKLWMATARGLWRRQDTSWQAIALPGSTEVSQLRATQQALWLLMHDRKTKDLSLYSSEAPKQAVQVLKMPAHDTTQFATTSLSLPKVARPGCNSIFALFYGITKYAAPGYDFPLTRKALRGHTEFKKARFVKTLEGKQQYFGAFVPNLRLARKLTALVSKKVKNSTPQLLCHKPKVLAELDFELATGKSKGWKDFTPKSTAKAP